MDLQLERYSDGTSWLDKVRSHHDCEAYTPTSSVHGAEGIATHLVYGRNDLRGRQDLLQLLLREVRHADGFDLALLRDCLHLFPGFRDRPGVVDVARPIRELRKYRIIALRVQWHGPMDQIH